MKLLGCADSKFPGSLANVGELAEFLAAAGLPHNAAADRAELFGRAAAALENDAPRCAFFVPGRIEVLGKHTDYTGGRTMIVAAERGFSVVAAPRSDNHVTVTDAGSACATAGLSSSGTRQAGGTVEFELDSGLQPALGSWANYPMTVARRIARNFPGISRGADIAFAGDLTPAAGMSSSSALMIAVFLPLAHLNDLAERAEFRREIASDTDLAGYLGTVENGQNFGALRGDRGVGTFGGSEDHTAILCGCAGSVSQYSYCPVRFERAVPLPPGYRFVVGVSGVVAEKTGAARENYNAASRRASALLEIWRESTGRNDRHLAAVLASDPGAEAELLRLAQRSRRDDFNAAALTSRLEQFAAESTKIIPAAGDALAEGNLPEFGRLVDQSQDLAERLLGNQVPETVHLAARAREHGAAAASAFGAGFGGSVWALVSEERLAGFSENWRRDYLGKYPRHEKLASFFSTSAAPAAFRVC